jgi:hypothetical protein
MGVTVVVPPLETFENVVVTSSLVTETEDPGGVTETFVTPELAEQPNPLVTVTEYAPEAETSIDCVVAPVDQRLEVAADDVSRTLPSGLADWLMIGTAGVALTVTVLEAEPRHEYWPVTSTE